MSALEKISGLLRHRAAALGERINALSDAVLVISLSLFYFLWRILSLPMFEFGGDAVWKWMLLHYYRVTGVWMTVPPDHHQGRWCQNLPVYWLTELFDSSSLYVAVIVPVLTGITLLLILWLITRSIGGSRLSAVLVWLTTMLCPVFACESAQYLPSLPAAMYTLFSLWLMICYLRQTERWYLPFFAGLTMGLAWGCKVTSVYFLCGIALFLLFHPAGGKRIFQWRRFSLRTDVLLLGAGFLLILIPETILLNRCFHVSCGRISMLMGHVDSIAPRPFFNVFQYLISPVLFFLDITHGKTIYVLPPALIFLLMIVPLTRQLRDRNLPLPQKLLAFSLFVALIFHCYFVIRVFPFKHPERPLPRYFVTLYYVSFVILYTTKPFLPPWKGRWGSVLKKIYAALFAALIGVMFIAWINEPVINRDNLFNTMRNVRCIRAQKQENLPLLVRCHKGKHFTSRTFKVAVLAKTFTAPTEDFPSFSGDRQKLFEAWAQLPLCRDTSGVSYFHAGGRIPQPGKTERCVVIDNEHWSLRTLQFAAGEENGAKEAR